MKKIKININIILLYLYTFILMYSPNLSYIIKIDNFILFGLATSLYLLKYMVKKDKIYFSFFKKKIIFIFIIINILATAYYAIRTVIAGTSITDFYNMRIIQNFMPIVYLMGALIIYHELDIFNYTSKQKYKFIINVVLLQSIIAIGMIFSQNLRSIALNIFYSNHEVNEYITRSRLYGICDGDYTYGFQILQGILALFILMYAYFYNEKRYVLYSLLALMVTFLNGRFGLIVFVLGIAFFMMYLLFKKMAVVKVLGITVLATIIGAVIIFLIYTYLPNTFVLIEHAYTDILSFINEDSNDTETSILVSMMFAPTGLAIIFGCGFRVFAGKGREFGFERASDVGFVNDAFMGGIIYMTLIYSSYLYLVSKIKRFFKRFSFERTMSNLLILSMILANIKGEVFRSQLLISNIILLLIFMLLIGAEKNKNV